MEKSNDGSFKFSSLVSSDSNWGETLPKDVLTDVSSNEKRDTTTKTISFLKEFIEQNDNNTSSKKL